MSEAPKRIWPDAADGSPALPMEPELWAAGCDLETARFVARQLANDGYTLVKSDLARAQVAAVKVKPLVWDDFDGGWGAKANALLIVNYLIVRRQCGRFEVSVSCPGYQTAFDGKHLHDALVEAKAAAQADYERRILGALEHIVDANALVAAAYEAAAQEQERQAEHLLLMAATGKALSPERMIQAAEKRRDVIAPEIRALTPDDAKAALDALLKAERVKAYEAAASAIVSLNDPPDPEDGYSLHQGDRPYICEESAYRRIRALAQEDE